MAEDFPKETLEKIWAPWRVEYYRNEHQSREDFLTSAATSGDDAAHLVVCRRKSSFLILNKYPYTAGHMMAVPYLKTSQMGDLSEEAVLELWQLVVDAQRLLKECVKAQGFNVGWNLGEAAGAGVVDHLHIHIVPRWVGDSNFMPVLASTRILPEALQPLYKRLLETKDSLGIK